MSPWTARARSRLRTALGGLRFRLVLGFALVAAVGAASAGLLTYREARTAVLKQSQDMVVNQFRDSVNDLVADISPAPAQEELDALVTRLARSHASQRWHVLVTYRDRTASHGPQDAFRAPPAEVARAVARKPAAVFQRVRQDGQAALVVGLPVSYTAESPGRVPSGLAFFLVVPQSSEQLYVEALVTAIERATLPALGLAVLLALLVARGVLRPVRALHTATRRMAEGRLDTRLAVQGSDELAGLSQAFNETAAALERSVAELRGMEARARRFAADVSHEMRTPLAAMSAVTDVLDADAAELERETGDALRLISSETARLARLVDDLMEISRFDAGAAELVTDEIDLAESLHRTLAARGWTDRVTTELPPPGTVRAWVDPRRLDVVVANLVGNALRHGAPPVTLRLDTDRPPNRPEAAHATIEVADSGPGIPEQDLPLVFERFYKADTVRTRSESSGLGLAIALENAALHGGRIHAANRPGGGCVFTLHLPLRPATDQGARP